MFRDIVSGDKKKNTIEEIKKDYHSIYIYGAGCIALDIYKILEKNDVPICGFFIDEVYFQEGLEICGYNVRKKSEMDLEKEYSAVVGIGDYWLGEQLKKNTDNIYNVYYMTNVSLQGEYINVAEKFINQIKDFEYITKMLADDFSIKCMRAWLDVEINQYIQGIMNCYEGVQGYFNNSVYRVGQKETFLDIGAFDGDTLRRYYQSTEGRFKKVWAVEFEQKFYSQLIHTVEELKVSEKVSCYSECLWSKRGMDVAVKMEADESQNSRVDKKGELDCTVTMMTETADHLLYKREFPVDLLKVNYRGQLETLKGAVEIISEDVPRICVMIGADPELVVDTFLFFERYVALYDFYVRFHTAFPERLALYAIPKKMRMYN